MHFTYAQRYNRANYKPKPHEPEVVWVDIGSTFRERLWSRNDNNHLTPKVRTQATGGGPRRLWFNKPKGSGSLEGLVFG